MSTTATIIVKVNKKDIGRFRKCDPTKLHLRTIADVEKNASLIYPGENFAKDREECVKRVLELEPLPTVEGMLEMTKRVKLPAYLEIYHKNKSLGISRDFFILTYLLMYAMPKEHTLLLLAYLKYF